ncbi:MAG: hypothetical protein GF335_05265 [Candidatus Moranbacteria bacterium]|nr:hypothetical protein [Candidatus Moranbacteria bacterium]
MVESNIAKLNFIEKIRYYSLLKKFDKQMLLKIRLFLEYQEELYEETDFPLPSWEAEKKILFSAYGFREFFEEPLQENDFLTDEELYRKRYIQSIEEMNSDLNFIQIREKLGKIQEKTVDALKSDLALLKEKFLKSDKEKRNVLEKAFGQNIKRFRKLKKAKLKNFGLCQNEILNIGIKNILNSLFQKGFLSKKKEGYYLTPSGIKMGELLWYLFDLKQDREGKFSQLYGNRPSNNNREINETILRLKKRPVPIFTIQSQIATFYLSLILLFFLITLLIMEKTFILEGFNQYLKQNHQMDENLKTLIILLFLIPAGILIISVIANYFYQKIQKSRNYVELKNKIFEQKE